MAIVVMAVVVMVVVVCDVSSEKVTAGCDVTY